MKKKSRQAPVKTNISGKPSTAAEVAAQKPATTVARPMLWLGLAAFAVYIPSLTFGLTDLDDGIFIHTFHEYNEDIGNLITSFQRGLFDAVKDTYYRPVFFDAMILNYQLSDHGQNLMLYHFINILFHVASVLLLYQLLTRLRIRPLQAFILSLIFAVHPVLSQAVAWIPGRNDTMLAISVLAFLITCIDYVSSGKIKYLLLSALFLILAYFTKETAVSAAPIAFILIVFVLRTPWRQRRCLALYASWAACFAVWYIVRAHSTVNTSHVSAANIMRDFSGKLPLFIQYFGKAFLPFNLSVFPNQRDTVYYYGIISFALVAAGIAFNKKRQLNVVLSGLGIYFLTLAPILIAPDFFNLQAMEHRLYLPIIGLLIIASQTVVFEGSVDARRMLYSAIAVAVLFSAVNFIHQQSFKSPLAFWSDAVSTSPHSSYANMMLAARIGNEQESDSLFLRAYALNPNERMLNYIYGIRMQSKDSVLASEKYFLAEKRNSGFYGCDFYLARVEMEKDSLPQAIALLQAFLQKEPKHPMANNNLLFMYIDNHQPDKAREQAKHIQEEGLELSDEARKELNM